MCYTREFDQPSARTAGETQFIDAVLEGWGKWTRSTGIKLKPTAAGDLWKIQTIIEATTHVMQLTDEAFVLVDSAIAKLPERLQHIVFVEYVEGGTQENKWKSQGLNRLAYRQRLHAAQWVLYDRLLPYIDRWRQ